MVTRIYKLGFKIRGPCPKTLTAQKHENLGAVRTTVKSMWELGGCLCWQVAGISEVAQYCRSSPISRLSTSSNTTTWECSLHTWPAYRGMITASSSRWLTTCLENPEMLGNLKHVTEKSWSWKSVPKLFITSWIFTFLWVFSSIQLILHIYT